MEFYNESCFDRLKKLPENSINLVVSDPPYAISFDASPHMKNSDWDKMSKKEYIELITNYLTECKRVLTPNGSAWIFFGPSMLLELIEAVKNSGMYIHFDQWKSICRQKGRGAQNKFKSQREDFVLVTKHPTNFVLNNIDDLFNYKENITNILNYYSGEVERPPFKFSDTIYNFKMPYYLSKTEKQIHSCQKSILLLYALIMNSSQKGDTVFDGFAGSGSCAIASQLAERNFIGCELESDMYEKAQNWISKFDYDNYKKNYLKITTWFGRLHSGKKA
jgi:site-specific DNA-methyltransferase (adenine-specific)